MYYVARDARTSNNACVYYKITNKKENHRGFQYSEGLNILIDDFNNDPNQSCCKGGLYFTDAANIFEFLNYGIYLREITLPTSDENFCMVKDNNKWRANMIDLGTKRYELFNVNTFNFLIEKGADIHADDNYALRFSAKNGARLINATMLHLLTAAAKKLKTFSSSFGSR